LLTTHLDVGGISRYVISLAKFLASKDNKVFIASSGGLWQYELRQVPNIKNIFIPINTKSIISPKVIKSYFVLDRFMKTQGIDIVHANTRVTQFLAYLLYKIKGIAYISTFHGCYRAHFFRRALKFEGVASIAVSNYVRDHLIDKLGIHRNRVRVVYNGIDVKDYQATGSSPAAGQIEERLIGSPVLGTVSRLTPEKNIHLLIEAMPLILKKLPNSQLVILGRGRQESYLRELTGKLDLEGKVIFLEGIAPSLVFQALDVFISLSEGEPFGLSVIEAQLSGVPVIVPGSGALGEIVDDRLTGIVLEESSPRSVCEAVNLILDNSNLRESLVANAGKKAEEHFSLEKMGESTLSLYKEVI